MLSDMENQRIDELLTRGVSAIYPSKEFLESKLKSGEKLTLYLGIDPTGPTLHLGHAIQLRKLSEFQNLGHKIVLLIGDFTAMIGDPTGKNSTRKMLTKEEVLQNAKLYKKQASKWISFKGPNKAELKYNSRWLSKMNLSDYIKLAANITVDQLLERDMFKRRREEGKPIFLHEFFYPLLQGYDSVALDVDGELGGNDQIFNMLAGRDLLKTLKGKEKFVLATKLLEDNVGVKMGKTEGNMVALNDNATEMFGKIMSWADNLILPGLLLCTKVSMQALNNIKIKLEGGLNPMEAKIFLAEELTAIYHGKGKARSARNNFSATFSKKISTGEAKEIEVSSGSLLSEVLVREKIISSKNEFRRLAEEGAVKNVDNGGKITDQFFMIKENVSLKIGKHRFVKIKIV